MPADGAEKQVMLVGTYTTRGSEGIYTVTIDPETGGLGAPHLVAKTENPSFLAVDPGKKHLYAVNEAGRFDGRPGGGVTVFTLDRATGALAELNREPTGGSAPCHLAVSADGTHLVVANYGDGTVTLFPLRPDGSLAPSSQTVRHTGSGPDKTRQKGPHAHGVTFAPTGGFVLVPDLGIDRIMGYRLDAAAHRLEPAPAATAAVTPGSGPRHITFHPNRKWAYAVGEMNAEVTLFSWNGAAGELKPVATAAALPAEFKGKNTAAEIAVHPNGRFLYASNRGHDSVAVFTLGADGTPAAIQHAPCGGKSPRSISLDPTGRFLVCANQDSDNLTILKVDPETGRLSPVIAEVKLSAPVCVLFP